MDDTQTNSSKQYEKLRKAKYRAKKKAKAEIEL
jgi:hypothetical protein